MDELRKKFRAPCDAIRQKQLEFVHIPAQTKMESAEQLLPQRVEEQRSISGRESKTKKRNPKK